MCCLHRSPFPTGPAALTDEQCIECAARGLLRGVGRPAQALFRTGDFGPNRSQVAVPDALEDGPRRVTALTAYTGGGRPPWSARRPTGAWPRHP
ncbi:hypothetical protein GCM10010240_21510 [Streptomyces griseoviridis]|nr:hypothetical protein GCM10010240_21510 [Streptomyces griseoviridis]